MSVLSSPPRRNLRWFAWVQVLLAALAMVATLPGRTHGLGMITERLLADLHLDRVSYASINLWAPLLGAAFCLPIGYLIERAGVRLSLTGVVLLLGAVVLLMCRISLPLAARVSEGLGGALSPPTSLIAILFVAVLLTRGLGQSALSVVSLAMVGKWFERRLSVAMAVFALLVAVGFIVGFDVGRELADWSWQAVWAVLGWSLLGFAPLAWLLVRDTPEAIGLSPDGKTEPAAPPTGLSLRQALATPAFWIFGLASSLYGLVASGVSLFNQSILTERGFDAKTFYSVAMGTTFVAMAGNFLGGWIALRWSIGRLMSVAMLGLALALFGLPFIPAEPVWALSTPMGPLVFYPQLVPYVLAMGMSGGIVTVLFFTIWGYAFGRQHLGKIQGVAQMLTVLASAVGPLLLAASKDYADSYVPMFYALAAVCAVFSVLAWVVPVPRAVDTAHPNKSVSDLTTKSTDILVTPDRQSDRVTAAVKVSSPIRE